MNYPNSYYGENNSPEKITSERKERMIDALNAQIDMCDDLIKQIGNAESDTELELILQALEEFLKNDT